MQKLKIDKGVVGMKVLGMVLLLLAFLIVPLNASAAEEGIISGRVINKTAGGGSAGKIKISLNGNKGNSSLPALSTGTNDKGDFEFKGVSTDSSTEYKLSTNYQGVDYESDGFSFKAGEKAKEVDLVVYDSTMESKDIKINLTHIIIFPGRGSLQAQEYYALLNGSDKSYAGSRLIQSVNQKETFTTLLPDGANSIEYLSGLMECCVAKEQGNLIDTMAITPAGKEIAFSYQFPYKSKDYTFTKTFEYPVETLNFVVEDKGLQVSGGGLAPQGPVNVGGKTFLVYNRKGISANETVKINISGLPAAPITASLKWWALGFVLVAVAAAITYPRIRKKNNLQTVPVSPSERERLIKQIAKLDDDFEEGRIPEGTYRRLRSQKKARLTELSRNKGGRGP